MKRKRAWWFIGGFAFLCGLLVFAFAVLGEHADYKRGAEALPEARKRAEELMGAMTWAEHRKQRGVEASRDEKEWIALEDSVPEMFEEYRASFMTGPVLFPAEELFEQNRDWLFSLASQIEPLRLTRPTVDIEEQRLLGPDLRASQELVRQIVYMLLGAADAGDADGVREAGRVGWMIIERQMEEYDLSTLFISSGCFHQMERYIVMGAVRNRHNSEIVQALREVMADRPDRPPFSEAVIGEARTLWPMVQELRDLKPGEIEEWVDSWFGSNSEYSDDGAFGEFVRSALQKLGRHEEPASTRRVGKHTAAALEARFWEAMVDCAEAAAELPYSKGDAHVRLRELDEFLASFADRSYEFAAISVPAGSANFYENNRLTMRDASAIALELIARFPDFADLPTALPANLASPDPFGGEPLLYKKTPHGFVIYSRFKNRIDDGYPLIGPDILQVQTLFTKSKSNLDWGLIVAYNAAQPLP
ncbi:MAG: hypothetical protein IH945_02005 [Armatimonadetes bacterium]|nr:hypothetical protein [Armatimonadota bacterium]